MSLTGWLKRIFRKQRISDPREAYDVWSQGYDDQPYNLMLNLDEQITGKFLEEIDLTGKTIADIGCGTGRHWKKFFSKDPAKLVGFDISPGMLDKLKQKYPLAETHLLEGNKLSALGNSSCDLVISTLTIAHIENIEEAFAEWNQVLKPGGDIIITENHPVALAKGGQRTFRHGGKLLSVRNYIHPIEKMRDLAGQLGWTETRFTERIVDDDVIAFYQQQNALAVYEKFLGVPIIYGIHLKKENDPS